MIFLFVFSLFLLFFSFSGYVFSQEVSDLSALQHLGTGGGAVGTLTGGYSLYQSSQNKKDFDQVWNKLAALETVDAGTSAHIERLSESVARLDRSIEHLDKTIRDMQMQFSAQQGFNAGQAANFQNQRHYGREETSL